MTFKLKERFYDLAIMKPFAKRLTVVLLFLFVGIALMSAQQITITGTISDEDGQTIPGANVRIKGTTQGTSTDANGAYSLQVPDANTTLQFSYIGYNLIEERVGSRRVINVTLLEDTKTLGEVVVLGYGTVRKSDLTGAVVTVKGKDLTYMPTNRADQALQGRAAGVYVQNPEGSPGANIYINIRGTKSIQGGNSVLTVVDGIQGADINTLNANDIESMEILKDASATAVYGARGSNGVILITTKRGQSGKPTISYQFDHGIQKVDKIQNIMTPLEYALASNDRCRLDDVVLGQINDNIRLCYPEGPGGLLEKYMNGELGTDWQDVCTRLGLAQTHNLSIRGGNESVRYYLSIGYLDHKGVMKTTDYNRVNVRSNIDATVNKWLNMGLDMYLMRNENKGFPMGEGYNTIGPLGQQIFTLSMFDPCTSVYDANGNLNLRANSVAEGTNIFGAPSWQTNNWHSPYAALIGNHYSRKNFQQSANAYLNFTILPGLTFRTSVSAIIGNGINWYYYDRNSNDGMGGNNGRGGHDTNQSLYIQNSNQLNYDLTLNDHHISATVVGEMQHRNNESLNGGQNSNFPTDLIGSYSLQSGATKGNSSNGFSTQNLNSWFGRVSYNYADRYLITANIRADGSSVFGELNKWGYFPSVAVGWNMKNESFMQEIELLSMLKWRASYGLTGNTAIGAYSTLAQVSMSNGNYPYFNGNTLDLGNRITRVANSGLKWETAKKLNIGLDVGLFNSRVNVTAEWYKETTTDLLANQLFPNYAGMGWNVGALANVGSMQNKGIEFVVDATPIMQNDFTWNTNVNISGNRNKILELANHENYILTNYGFGMGLGLYLAGVSGLKQMREGEDVDSFYGWIFEGLWTSEERMQAAHFRYLPGQPKYKEFPDPETGQYTGKYDAARDGNNYLGSATPKCFFGWTNNFRYKNVELAMLLQGTYGQKIFNAVRARMEDASYGSPTKIWDDRWTTTNQNTNIERWAKASERGIETAPYVPNSEGNNAALEQSYQKTISTRYLEDGSYLRMKTLSLTYNLPQALISRVNMNRLAVSATVTNLLTLTKYSGTDPEVSSFNRTSGQTGTAGIDGGNYPSSKTFTFSLNITF